jgi:cobalt-zinc-cadmium efflux system outer membrane protein
MSRLIIICTLLSCALSGRAATFTVESAVNYALKNNRDLAAARYSIEQARGRLIHSGRLPNPELETELKPNVRGREFSLSAGFMQKYPLTNRLWLERAISQAELRAAEAEVLNEGRLLAGEVRIQAVKLQALAGMKTLKQQQRKNSTALGEEAARIAKEGEGSGLEAAQFELEAQQLSLDMLQLETEQTTIVGTLRPLLGLKATESVSISGELSAPSGGGNGVPSVEQRPDYRAARAKEEAARTGVELARKGKWEDASYGLSASFERTEDAPDGLGDDGFIGFKFSLPLPFWNKNEGKIHEAEATAARAAKEREALALQIRSQATAAQAEMAAAQRIIAQIAGTLLPKAVELEERITTARKEGQAQPVDVLRAREKRLALETARLNALRDYHLARARLLSAQGR